MNAHEFRINIYRERVGGASPRRLDGLSRVEEYCRSRKIARSTKVFSLTQHSADWVGGKSRRRLELQSGLTSQRCMRIANLALKKIANFAPFEFVKAAGGRLIARDRQLR